MIKLPRSDFLALITILLVITLITFGVAHNSSSNKSISNNQNIFTPFYRLYTGIKSVANALHNISTASSTSFTFKIIVNYTRTLNITFTTNTQGNGYYAMPEYTFTISGGHIIYDNTTTFLYSIDYDLIEEGNLNSYCSEEQFTQFTTPFWPENFLQFLSYTNVLLTAINYCNNEYYVTAHRATSSSTT